MQQRHVKNIHPDFFCDGPYYFLTSSSLGGSPFSPEDISDQFLQSAEGVVSLLEQGIGLPLFFPTDCALDNGTRFVYGELSEQEQQNWLGKLTAKLKVPCGKVILLAGGGDAEHLARALAGETPDPNFHFYDTFELPAGDYRVDLYCYLDSVNFAIECEALESDYRRHFADIGIAYLFQFRPLEQEELHLPELIDEIGWCGVFSYRPPNHVDL